MDKMQANKSSLAVVNKKKHLLDTKINWRQLTLNLSTITKLVFTKKINKLKPKYLKLKRDCIVQQKVSLNRLQLLDRAQKAQVK